MEINKNLHEFEEKIGYSFNNIKYLELALTHSSLAHERMLSKNESNERIEFLGDAVLELVSSEYLYTNYPEKTEGELTKLRASLVCEPSLAADAREINLPDFIKLGVGENKMGGRSRDSISSDAFEAVIGAIYLDGGLAPAKNFILKYVLNDVIKKALFYDSKTHLQEFAQNVIKKSVRYEIVSENGPDHDKEYVACVYVGDDVICNGTGHTKKAAEMEAAYKALMSLKLK